MSRTSQLVLDGEDENERELRSADLRRVGAVALILAVLAASAVPLSRTSTSVSSSVPVVRSAAQACVPPGVAIKTGAMTVARSGHTATLLRSGRVLVAGGWISQSAPKVTSAAELYDPTNGTWTSTGSMNVARGFHSAVVLPSGMVLVAGGIDGFGPLASAELYDPRTGTWTATGSMHDGRDSFPAVVLRSGKVFVVGGGLSGWRGAELYDPAAGTWSVTGSEIAQLATSTVLPSGKVLVAGGSLSTQLFDPATNAWEPAGSLADWRSWHTATLLRSGKVLVAGGDSESPPGSRTSSAELYEPATNTWTQTSSMTSAHAGAQAILLASGQVVILGGGLALEKGGSNDRVDLYDPVSATWTALGPLTTPRTLFTATLLPRGAVLIAGGEGNSAGVPYASTEIYDLACIRPH